MVHGSVLLPLIILGGVYHGEGVAEMPYGLDRRPVAEPFLNLPRSEKEPFPDRLSRAGVFRDLARLAPGPSLIPYALNVEFWSDGAAKRRWISIPFRPPAEGETIRFSANGDWGFPPGTVLVKHFELADDGQPARRRRLETRILVVGTGGNVHGASYRWRADGSDADRVDAGVTAPIPIRTSSGARSQNWYFPGPADCRQCHTPAAGGVLGVKARQLDRDMTYPAGVTDNQLRTWNHLGLFDPAPSEADLRRIARLVPGGDAGADLERRARSYLDANCSHCHRPGGAAADFDARYETPLGEQRLLGQPARINFGVDGARFIAPNDPWRSTVLTRVETLEPTKMPPLAHEVVDRRGAELLRAWIASLPGPPVLAPPTIRPASGDYRGSVQVEIRSDDPAAVVRYTLDGSAPTPSSTVYRGPFVISRSTTVRARAYRPGYTRSISTQATMVIDD